MAPPPRTPTQPPTRTPARTIAVKRNLLLHNDAAAAANRARFARAGVLAVNLVAAPGAGKTSLIGRTVAALAPLRIGVIEGDIAGSIDTEKVLAAGAADAVQINTGGTCHLEASMVGEALDELAPERLDLVLVENVGNLICPTAWDLGEHLRICLVSASEGDDKPLKYPTVFARSHAVALNKVDLIPFVDFDERAFCRSVRALNPDAPIFRLSCRSGAGVARWASWLEQRRADAARATTPGPGTDT